jgi:hypothetical protein
MTDPNFYEKVGTEKRSSGNRSGGRWDAPEPAATAPTVAGDQAVQAMIGAGGTGSERRWAANDKTFWGVSSTYDSIPAGVYRPEITPNLGPILVRQNIETDNLLELPDEAASEIIAEFQAFWRLGPEFRKRGFLHKRGFLLWGPPGSGKTSTVQVLIKRLADEMDGVTLFLDHPQTASAGLQMLRHIEPKRPLIAVMEDMDALIEKWGENEYLAVLDGEAQVDNVVFLATTNYPERLDSRFVDRPSRFDTIRFVGMPSAAARRAFLSAKEPGLSDGELTEWVRKSDGFSVAHLKEMIIAVKCFGQPLDEVVDRLEGMHARKPTSGDDPDKRTVGFAPRRRASG